MTIVCIKCGKEASVLSSASRMCHQCSKSHSSDRAESKTKRYCKKCGKLLSPSYRRDFCNDDCKKLFKERDKTRKCRVCSKRFSVDKETSNKRFCCHECASFYKSLVTATRILDRIKVKYSLDNKYAMMISKEVTDEIS